MSSRRGGGSALWDAKVWGTKKRKKAVKRVAIAPAPPPSNADEVQEEQEEDEAVEALSESAIRERQASDLRAQCEELRAVVVKYLDTATGGEENNKIIMRVARRLRQELQEAAALCDCAGVTTQLRWDAMIRMLLAAHREVHQQIVPAMQLADSKVCIVCAEVVERRFAICCRTAEVAAAAAAVCEEHWSCASCTRRFLEGQEMQKPETWLGKSARILFRCLDLDCRQKLDPEDLNRAECLLSSSAASAAPPRDGAVPAPAPQILSVLVQHLQGELSSRKKARTDAAAAGVLSGDDGEQKKVLEALVSQVLSEVAQHPLCPSCCTMFNGYTGCNAVRCNFKVGERVLGCQAFFCGVCQLVFADDDDSHDHARNCHSVVGSPFTEEQRLVVAKRLVYEQQVAEFVHAQVPEVRAPLLDALTAPLTLPDRSKYDHLESLSMTRIRILVNFGLVRDREDRGSKPIPGSKHLFGAAPSAASLQSDYRADLAYHHIAEPALREAGEARRAPVVAAAGGGGGSGWWWWLWLWLWLWLW